MFKFNFDAPTEDEEKVVSALKGEDVSGSVTISSDKGGDDKIHWLSAKVHNIDNSHRTQLDEARDFRNVLLSDDTFIHVVDSVKVVSEIKSVSVESDLIPGVYEGGLKIWECSEDLMQYVDSLTVANNDGEEKSLDAKLSSLDIKNMRVLELGCGAGLPGLLCALRGAKSVALQDYNPEVLDHITIPNALNLCEQEIHEDVFKFYSGDWGSLADILKGSQFDLILTSETIYNVNNQSKLLTLFEECLSDHVDSRILVAAKVHYFGVGGGLRQFERALDDEKIWQYCTVSKCEEGVQREIIEIRRKQN